VLVEECELALSASGSVMQVDPGRVVVAVGEGFCARLKAISAMLPTNGAFTSQVLTRRHLGRPTEEPMGGHTAPFVQLDGDGHLILDTNVLLTMIELDKTGFVYLRESSLVGFQVSVRHENGRLGTGPDEQVPMLQLSGRGAVLFQHKARLISLTVSAERSLSLRGDLVLGWTGRLLTQPLASKDAPNHAHGFVAFSGDGAVFIDGETGS
jgi:uncharacterized protein (AIM24 family)